MKKLLFVLVAIFCVQFASSQSLGGPTDLTLPGGSSGGMYVLGYYSFSGYIPADHTLVWSVMGPNYYIEDPGYFSLSRYVRFYNEGYYTIVARPYHNVTGYGAVAATLTVYVHY